MKDGIAGDAEDSSSSDSMSSHSSDEDYSDKERKERRAERKNQRERFSRQLNEHNGFKFQDNLSDEEGLAFGNDIEEGKEQELVDPLEQHRRRKKQAKILDLARKRIIEEFGSEVRLCDSECSQCQDHDHEEPVSESATSKDAREEAKDSVSSHQFEEFKPVSNQFSKSVE